MKICRYEQDNEIKFGAIKDDLIFPLDNFSDVENQADSLILTESIKQADIKLLLPVTPSKIVCVGRNYAAHAAELGNEVPKEPLLFLKAPSSLIINEDSIFIPSQSHQVEHEGELAVIIGRGCKNLTEDDNSLDYIFGYTCLNDVTARDLQRRDVQFTRAKSFDTFCPIGSFIETELDASDVRVITRVNGVIKQDGRTSQMVFPVDFLIRYISNQMTLNAGDIIATGTPSGVSQLNKGDICEVEIEGIGILRNPVE
jgi:2-keto-4-pentenoate hydratase/2-oxohepta-3-ene-1,7-dioic acid hydratase in catechol pathway